MRILLAATALIWAVGAAHAQTSQEIANQCPAANEKMQALSKGMDAPDSNGMSDIEKLKVQCAGLRAFIAGVPQNVEDWRKCQAGGAVGVEGIIQQLQAMGVQMQSMSNMLCR